MSEMDRDQSVPGDQPEPGEPSVPDEQSAPDEHSASSEPQTSVGASEGGAPADSAPFDNPDPYGAPSPATTPYPPAPGYSAQPGHDVPSHEGQPNYEGRPNNGGQPTFNPPGAYDPQAYGQQGAYNQPAGYDPHGSYNQPAGYNPQSAYDPQSGYNPQGGYDPNYGSQSGYGVPSGYAPGNLPPGSIPPSNVNPPEPGDPSYGTGHTTQVFGFPMTEGSTAAPGEPAPSKESSAKARPARTALIAAVVAAVIGGGIGAGTVAIVDHNDSSNGSSISVSGQGAPVSAKIDGSVSGAAAKIQPSVVTIDVTGQQEEGTGSGVILRSDGYILTNNHVIDVASGGGTITVVTNDGQQAKATLVGTDPSDDLAVVKVSGLKNLTPATFGKSSGLIVGQTVVAVGAPLGLSDTVTSGIVSNTARPVTTGDSQTNQAVFNAVQTDAAINPGNSGGPLVDLNGNVVGINAAIATANSGGLQIPGQSSESGSIGIGFAIPSDEASRIANQLIATGKATHAVIGVTVQGDSSGSSVGTAGTTVGATIQTVTANGAAAAAGLQKGDVVTAVGSQRIDDSDGLIAAVRSHAPGEKVAITYTRSGASKTVQVTLGTASS
jgi:putative serine protease PepD